MTETHTMRVIVMREGEFWVAQCLEYDICTSASDMETLELRMQGQIECEAQLSEQLNGAPFAGIGAAPERFHQMWEDARKFEAEHSMPSFEFDIGDKEAAISRFLSAVHTEIQRAFSIEKSRRKLTQQSIADTLGVNRSVINRQVMGYENLTAKSIAELAWAIGYEPKLSLSRRAASDL